MLKANDIKVAFELFEKAGLRNGPQDKEAAIGRAEAFLEILGDSDPADFAQACRAYSRTSPFWPTPGDIGPLLKGTAQAALEQEDRRVDYTGILAATVSSAGRWATSARLRHCFTSYARSRLQVEATEEEWQQVDAAVAGAGGWDALAMADERDLGFLLNRIRKALGNRQEQGGVLSLAEERQKRARLQHGNPKRIGG